MHFESSMSRMYWFYRSSAGKNFGDWIGPFLYKARRGHEPVYTEDLRVGVSDVLFTCGSILHKISESDRAVVWGSGAIEPKTSFREPRKILAIRGPLSRALCLAQGYECPDVYGDPGLLLPEFWNPKRVTRRWRLGVVPHFVDFADLSSLLSGHRDVKIIDVRRNVTEVVDDILTCDAIVSTSLHGVIVSLAYRIPTLWARFSDRIIGGNFKFRDFYLGAGLDDPPEPFFLRENLSVDALLHEAKCAPSLPTNFSCDKLLSCCPF